MSTENSIREDLVLALGSEYEIVRELGRGGASVVYLGRDLVLGREVAIKVIRDTHTGDAEAVARFQREARTLAALQHPNIVMLHGAKALPGGSLALVMQHGGWNTLKSLIREQGPMPVDAVRQVLQDMASALVYLHRHQVIHRDIKPENIFIEVETGRALLSDFGIAKSGDSRTSVTLTGVVIGTPAYMSPEQIDGGDLTGRSDIYSLGMVGYEMLTGVRPWDGESLFSVIYKQKTEKLPSLAQVRPDAPESLRRVIERATEKTPDARWSSAQEILQELGGAMSIHNAPAPWAEAPIPASRPDALPPTEYPTLEIEQALADEAFEAQARLRTRKQRLMAAVVVLLLFSGGAGALAFSSREAPTEASLDRTATRAMEPIPSYPEEDSASGATLPELETSYIAMEEPIVDSSSLRAPPATPGPESAEPTPGRAQVRTAAVPEPEAEPEQGETSAAPPRGPAAIIPELSVTRPRSLGSSTTPTRELEGRPAETVTPPRLRNRDLVGQLLADRYPSDLRIRGIGGTAIVTVLVTTAGTVEDSRIVTSSGNPRLDEAALAVAPRMLFTQPTGMTPKPTWVAVPLTFSGK